MTERPDTEVDRAAVRSLLQSRWLDGLTEDDAAEGHELLGWLVDDLADEADRAREPGAVLHIQLEDLDALRPAGGSVARLMALRAHVLRRRVERLGVATFALGRGILDGSVDAETGRASGITFRHQAEQLGTQIQELSPSAEKDAARRELSEVVMEVLFAEQGEAMSLRLSRAAPDSNGAGGGPPNLRP